MKNYAEFERALNMGNQSLISKLIPTLPLGFKLLKMIVRHNCTFALKEVMGMVNSDDQLTGKEGFTILHYSVLNANSDTVELIMKKFPWIATRQTTSGFNALHFAVRTGNKDTIYILVENNRELLSLVNVNEKNPIQLGLQESSLSSLKHLFKAMKKSNSEDICTQLNKCNVNPKGEMVHKVLAKLNSTNNITNTNTTSVPVLESMMTQSSETQENSKLLGSTDEDYSTDGLLELIS